MFRKRERVLEENNSRSYRKNRNNWTISHEYKWSWDYTTYSLSKIEWIYIESQQSTFHFMKFKEVSCSFSHFLHELSDYIIDYFFILLSYLVVYRRMFNYDKNIHVIRKYIIYLFKQFSKFCEIECIIIFLSIILFNSYHERETQQSYILS